MTAARWGRGRRIAACALLAGVLTGGGCQAERDLRPVATAAPRHGAPDSLFGRIDATLTLAIEQSRLAALQATNPDLRAFAADRVAHYVALRADLRATAYDLDLQPANVVTLALPGDRRLDALHVARGAQFDRAYVRQALEVHQRLLGDLDAALRRVRDDDLRRALRAMRSTMPGSEEARATDDTANGESAGERVGRTGLHAAR